MMDHGETSLHLRAIRKALADGNAAVMVGAGFSRNADGGDQLATWPQLAELLWRELNPTDKSTGSFSAGQITQLAEQYALVFSPPALENFLKREVPDDKVSPGDLHDQLLRLPWSDIFTTNYDTLLERAAEKDIGRAHYTVGCREDIPQSKVLNRRRIVKLHGSFPSLRPFIFTEEDYRRYPEKFAPFVNMVRQSLLENVFCLVGFSGEDPNFLNWIGWIRDMLDKHALPIYLFVTNEPEIGLRRLLESRRVTPVVLPSSNQGDDDDYRSRYAELFRILATPLKPSDANWTASLQLPKELRTIVETNEERITRLLSIVPNLRQLRKDYPGWLVAPSTVRTNLHRRLQELPISLEAKILYGKEGSRSSLVRIILLDQYAWFQDVLLQCLNDSLAELAIKLLRDTREFQDGIAFSDEKEGLKAIGVTSLKEVQRAWRYLGLALLRWARQELNEAHFEEIKTLLSSTFVSDQDIGDELVYEMILFALYSGERDEARRLLLDWKLRTTDAYMGIRKGALLAEVEEGVVGLAVSIDALQSIRRRQKLRPDSTRYSSEEAWANYIVQRQHDAMSFSAPKSIDTHGYEAIGRRLADLAAKGFDVQAEIREIAADLNSEAQPPSTPRALKQRFDLGRYIPAHGTGTGFSLNKKVSAAFAWLSLSDRVGLAPRMNRVSFDLTSYTQAAWWLQNFDSSQRVLSVAIRTLDKKVLEPKDDAEPPHMSGWLTRFQIAKSEESLAVSMCQRSLRIVERDLAENVINLKRSVEFHLELISRFVIRVTDHSVVRSIAERIIGLHEGGQLSLLPDLWDAASIALKRCFEALPYEMQNELVVSIARLSLPPLKGNKNYINHFSLRWLSLFNLFRTQDCHCEDDSLRESASLVGDQLLDSLRNIKPDGLRGDTASQFLWERLVLLDHFGLLPEPLRLTIGKHLWKSAESWPCMSGNFFPKATSRWPMPEGIDADRLLREWVLAQRLKGFSTTIEPITPKGVPKLGWSLVVNDFVLQTWLHSLERQPWTMADMRLGLLIIKAWWDDEWSLIENSFDNLLESLRTHVIDRLDELDAVLAKGLSVSWENDDQLGEEIISWLRLVMEKGRSLGAMFWRLRLRGAIHNNDTESLTIIQREMAEGILNIASSEVAQVASEVLEEWITKQANSYRPTLLLDSIAGVVGSRRMHALIWALHLLVKVAQFKPQWLTDNIVALIELGATALLRELSYQDRVPGTSISDDDVPALRFNCARLAFALSTTRWYEHSQTWSQWLQQAENDPLPEMRYLRERWVGPMSNHNQD